MSKKVTRSTRRPSMWNLKPGNCTLDLDDDADAQDGDTRRTEDSSGTVNVPASARVSILDSGSEGEDEGETSIRNPLTPSPQAAGPQVRVHGKFAASTGRSNGSPNATAYPAPVPRRNPRALLDDASLRTSQDQCIHRGGTEVRFLVSGASPQLKCRYSFPLYG